MAAQALPSGKVFTPMLSAVVATVVAAVVAAAIQGRRWWVSAGAKVDR
jgi:hypothetical protein